PGRERPETVAEHDVGDATVDRPGRDVVAIAQADGRELLVGELGHGRTDAPRATRELPSPHPAVLARRRVAAWLPIGFLEKSITVQAGAIPQEHAIPEDLIEISPRGKTVAGEVLVPPSQVLHAGLQASAARPVRRGSPQMPGVVAPLVVADGALLDD